MAERGDPTRLVDANGNRAAEGLRVLEDLARFLLDDADLSRRLKELRHELRAALPAAVIAARDTPGDVGTRIAAADEGTRARLGDLITANARRAAEALRVLEECGKLPGLPAAAWEGMRYRLYECERLLQARLQLARLWRERLYVLVDAALCADPVAVAGAAAGGGAGIVQLRAKALAPRPYAELARAVQAAARSGGALFVVNDHPAVAAAIGADGVHVGQDDLSLTDVRRVVGPLCLIGSSAHTPDQLRLAESGGADYCGLGPMYATGTKPHEPERGPALLDAVRADIRIPSYAIGGLDAERVRALLPRLPHGIAVAGCVCSSPDPAAVCAALLGLLGNRMQPVR